MLKKLFKTGVTAAAGWVGNAIGGPTGSMFAKKITSSLFDRDGAGGNFQLQDTSVAPQNYGGRVGFERSTAVDLQDQASKDSMYQMIGKFGFDLLTGK